MALVLELGILLLQLFLDILRTAEGGAQEHERGGCRRG